MIIGRIDIYGRALLPLSVFASPAGPVQQIEAWVDTGFTGELVLPKPLVDKLGLTRTSLLTAALADGSRSVLKTYTCGVNWFGVNRTIEVIANDGEFPLLGVGLLLGHRLVADYAEVTLSVE